jgi:uncharacterized membrane protein YheB (UPF0754 family)
MDQSKAIQLLAEVAGALTALVADEVIKRIDVLKGLTTEDVQALIEEQVKGLTTEDVRALIEEHTIDEDRITDMIKDAIESDLDYKIESYLDDNLSDKVTDCVRDLEFKVTVR